MKITKNTFDHWNEKKKITHQRKGVPYFNAGEIWWVQIGKNIASESIGKGDDFLRPVLILQKFFGHSALAIPLTSQEKSGSYYFPFVDLDGNSQTAILPQIRYIDGRRLQHQLSAVDSQIFVDIQNKFFKLIKNNPQPEGGGS